MQGAGIPRTRRSGPGVVAAGEKKKTLTRPTVSAPARLYDVGVEGAHMSLGERMKTLGAVKRRRCRRRYVLLHLGQVRIECGEHAVPAGAARSMPNAMYQCGP